MSFEERLPIKKKVFIAVCLALFVIICAGLILLYGPMPMRVDWSKVQPVENNVMLLAPNEGGNPSDGYALVKMNPDDTIDDSPWHVLQFTDMHLSDKMDGTERTINHYIDAIQREKPDYVVLTGDIITSIRGRSRAIQFAEIMEKLGVYWSYCLGNHEGDQVFALSRAELMRIWEKYPHAVLDDTVRKTAAGEKVWGIGNFVVNLLGANYTVVQSMIFMDSGNEISKADAKKFNVAKDSYDYLKDSQKTWYKEQVEKAIAFESKSMLFIHIPLVEQAAVKYLPAGTAPDAGWSEVPNSELTKGGNVIGRLIVKDGWNVLAGTGNYEGVCSSDYNNGMYALMKSLRTGINGLFNGHDHINNSVIYEEYGAGEDPFFLCYGTCSGYATYNLYTSGKTDDPTNLMKGYSIIDIHADSEFDFYGVWYEKEYERIPYIINSLPYAG